MDKFNLERFIRDFKAGKNPYDPTNPQPITENVEGTTPETPQESTKGKYLNEFLAKIEAKLKEMREKGGGVAEAKKKDEEGEEVEISDEEEINIEDPETQNTGGGDQEELKTHLESALGIARSMGDEKLADQIGNTITFYTRQYVAGDN